MSGSIPSAFGDPNVLYKNLSGQTTQAFQQNQFTISDHDIALTGQAAAPLLGMSEEDAARAYPDVVRTLQAAGGGKFAPPTYPGHAATAALVQRAMPLLDQYKMGFITDPTTQGIVQRYFPGVAGAGGGGGTGTGGGRYRNGGWRRRHSTYQCRRRQPHTQGRGRWATRCRHTGRSDRPASA